MGFFDRHVTVTLEPPYDCRVCEILFKPAKKFGECFRIFTIASKVCLNCGQTFETFHQQAHPHANPGKACRGFRCDGIPTFRGEYTHPLVQRHGFRPDELLTLANRLQHLANTLEAASARGDIPYAEVMTWLTEMQSISAAIAHE